MISLGRHSILGVGIDAVDYEEALRRIFAAVDNGAAFAVSALAVHGVMTGALNAGHRRRLNDLDLVVPDGQPVRWALRWLHGLGLPDRVRGPTLMLAVCERAASQGVPVYLYGSTRRTLESLSQALHSRYPDLEIAGLHPSAFRTLTADEQAGVAREIRASGARIVFVGLGCPRQEIWVYENRDLLSVPALAVGAAFDFHAGTVAEAPVWMQSAGLEWLYRLATEPRRLWRRYLLLNPLYLLMVAAQALKLYKPDSGLPGAPAQVRVG